MMRCLIEKDLRFSDNGTSNLNRIYEPNCRWKAVSVNIAQSKRDEALDSVDGLKCAGDRSGSCMYLRRKASKFGGAEIAHQIDSAQSI
jgi:hypothetical protein